MNRLFEIVYILLKKGNVTANYLAEHFEVSVRTIYRDIETLSMAGIPIYATRGKNGGISIMDNFVFEKSIVSSEEQMQILAALQSIQEADKSNSYSALSKLCGIFKIENPNWVSIDFSDWSDQQQELFSTIKSAILTKHVIRFDYYSSYGQFTSRDVEPIQLWLKNNTWFLKAYCKEKKAVRIFKLTRIKRIKYLEETFVLKDLQNEDEVHFLENKTEKMISYSMWIDKCMAYRVFDSFDEDQIRLNEDGSFTVSACFPLDEWVYGMILSYGNYAKIISPDFLKEDIVKRLKKSLDNYK